MNYKEEYNAIVQRCRELHESGNALTKQQMEIVCPQLKESEDERIRKVLLNYHKNAPEQYTCGGLTNAEVVAWLEKQKEQKPSEWSKKDLEKILKPKFNRGDKITNGENIYTIWKIEHDCYVLDKDCCFLLPFDCQEKWERVQEFKSTNWSEEEIGHLYTLARYIKSRGHEDDGEFLEGVANKLKSLRPQLNWKPSEEQMDALARATNRCVGVEDAKILIKLLEQLEKL